MLESWSRAFEDVYRQTVDCGIFDCAACVRDFVLVCFIDTTVDDLISIADNGKIRIVRHDDDLAFAPRLPEARH